MKTISGKIVDVVARTVKKGVVCIENGKIVEIKAAENVDDQYILPGFVDAHIHIESSMMLPAEFARYSVVHGTVACVCDPHEIANVCGIEGVDYMIENGKQSPLKFYFGAPSCVPSTHFETSGAELDAGAVDKLLQRDDIYFLAEMMNFPGVIHKNKQVQAKLDAAKRLGKPIDGHAPEISGEDLRAYAAGGITTDHECMTIAEAEAKIALGMKIQIREGSAAKNFDDLLPLVSKYPDKIMFCSDDKHPDDLLRNGHINSLVRRAVAQGYDVMDILRICSLTPVKHYKLDVGLLQKGDAADFIVVDNLTEFNVIATYIDGEKVSENGIPAFPRYSPTKLLNQFNAEKIGLEQLVVKPIGKMLRVIEVDNGQLMTRLVLKTPKIKDGNVISDTENDILKMVVYNRYQPSKPAIGFIKNIGLKRGALASTVSHDSHNIVAVGTSDEEIVSAINQVIDSKGGILACEGDRVCLLPLPVGGVMSVDEGSVIARLYEEIDAMAKELGSTLNAPFMTLAFMSLLVIPELKLGDRGLFDGKNFKFVELME
ncbi:Adenine deaminase [Paludibacter propionicigenes WB4]|uniref:Adenine deaminase n=1 Tax=Paludibacter propionicigenes (strain DSM 17365 / JCM 13257 / WB4) TaxID=694427 RepID=E4T482_PALPW|nr:adenine deaminase [Paludibacter propionicigenes]ADQ79526.1 Adenine deaminase [Paludibacter propionicigenes WB4]